MGVCVREVVRGREKCGHRVGAGALRSTDLGARKVFQAFALYGRFSLPSSRHGPQLCFRTVGGGYVIDESKDDSKGSMFVADCLIVEDSRFDDRVDVRVV